MNEHVFALDIGTQSVTGILLEKLPHTYKIVDFCVKQHNERSMLDGQIQNVLQVAEIIKEVKNDLEQKHGSLHKVCVAAAGRSLKTIQTDKSLNITGNPLTTEEEVRHLELSAVQSAQALLAKEDKLNFSNYHCVGYSVLHYKLDDEPIGSLIDQAGNEATVEIIATFLPKIVVESLLAALERADLKMEALTLEPIAAIHVLIPESMRRLNVALIDIGAGTSDIAISNDGTVIAYGMVPVAGDEITEAISDHYLLDFKIAEETKRRIVNEKTATIADILGFETTIHYDELVPHISDSVNRLANLLAQEIRNLNAKTPQAVMLIGGGSLTPLLNEKIAEYLQLPTNRVAVRGVEAISGLEQNESIPTGPDFVTPIGIAISAKQNPLRYITVYVNEKVTLMFATKQLTVGDALIQAGIEVNKYYGKLGLASIITLNGEKMTIRGKYGKPPIIYVNGELASVDSVIDSEDQIIIEKGSDGEVPVVTIEEIAGKMPDLTFTFNNEKKFLKTSYKVNGQVVDASYEVQDNDQIEVFMPKTIADFLQSNDDSLPNEMEPFIVTVNEQKVVMNQGSKVILQNGQPANLSDVIHENDNISIVHPEIITVQSLLDKLNKQSDFRITVTFNGERVELSKKQLIVQRNDSTLQIDSELKDGDKLSIIEEKVGDFIFQDVFRFIDLDFSRTKGSYQLYKNDEPTTFHDAIIHGDNLEIIWE